MGDDGAADLVAQARELERRDYDVAARIDATTASCARSTASGRERCEYGLGSLLFPARLRVSSTPCRTPVAARRWRGGNSIDAEGRLEKVRHSRRAGEDALQTAERDVRRTTVAVADAGAAVSRAHEHLRDLAGEEVALLAEREGLATEARIVAAAVADVPRLSESGRTAPGGALEEIEEWAARAHAALFVVRGGLENERERIVLEANSLAAAALGEQGSGASVSLVRKQLEASLLG